MAGLLRRLGRRLAGPGAVERAAAVDAWITSRLVPADPGLDAALAANAAAGLPAIDVSPAQGKLLHLLARSIGARRILEVGTLGGYSTIWLARALPPEGRLVTLEAAPSHAEVARANIDRAGLSDRVELRIGPALDTLPDLGPAASFDLAFIDADKANNAAYLDHALRLVRPGGLVVCDNVVRGGAIADGPDADPAVRGNRALFDRLASEPRLLATAVQTVGAKGWDGFAIALVL
jgi:predicted O-methyltransferase YrrM